MTPEELAKKYSLEILELVLEIKEMEKTEKCL